MGQSCRPDPARVGVGRERRAERPVVAPGFRCHGSGPDRPGVRRAVRRPLHDPRAAARDGHVERHSLAAPCCRRPPEARALGASWRGGFIALGGDAAATPIGLSPDGVHWQPPARNTTTFWPGLEIVGMAEVSGGVVALTLLDGTWDCSGASACPTFGPGLPLMSWTSPDGREWTPNAGPDLGQPAGWQAPPLLVAGPTGLVVASPTTPARVATSVDGIHWQAVAAGALPAGLAITGIAGTSDGFAAVGTLEGSTGHDRAVAFTSRDGETWTGPAPLDPGTASGLTLVDTGPSWGATALVAARDGLVAVGRVFATPGATLWWQSSDGTRWRPLPGYPPLEPATCTGEGCGSEPDGILVGDGGRMVALRGGTDAGAWSSTDGLSWRRLTLAGDVPAAPATRAGLLPGGVLVTDGTVTWFGEAQGQ